MTLRNSRRNQMVGGTLVLVLMSVVPGARAQDRGPAGTVTLSRTDYDRMLDLASREVGGPELPPMAAALTRADIRVRVNAGIVRATMTVDGEVFASGAVKVPFVSGATLIDARLADRPLPLIAEGNTHVAVMAGPGAFSATLEWGAPVTTAPGRGSFVLPVPPAGAATATIDVPGEQSDVRVTPGLVVRRTSAGGRTTIETTLDPGSPAQVSWSARDARAPAAARDVRLLADLKSLVTIGDADTRLLTLVDLTIVQGEPSEIELQLPAGYELTGITGVSLDRSEERGERVALFVSDPARRRHQFLISLERASAGGSHRLDTRFPTIPAAQRETGEIAVEALGTVEITAAENVALRRIDVREVAPALAAAAQQSLLVAFRYQRGSEGPPALALDVTRFADAAVLAAVAEHATATTLLTTEGRALTEIALRIRNRAQPFLKVSLPPGATMLSVEVAGEAAKPAEAADGTRVPLLRPGFRPNGPYTVSFVYLHAGTPFAKKGEMQMALPRMDVPITLVEWELFVPDSYRADRFAGSAIPVELLEQARQHFKIAEASAGQIVGGAVAAYAGDAIQPGSGAIVGRIVDPTGAALPGATVVVEGSGQRQSVVTDQRGGYVVFGLPTGQVVVTGQLAGFKSVRRSLYFDQSPRQVDFTLEVGAPTETLTVTAEAPVIDTRSSTAQETIRIEQRGAARADRTTQAEPSLNVQSLQRRAAGVLPVRIDIPRAGTSHLFAKPLVVDETVGVGFRYRQR